MPRLEARQGAPQSKVQPESPYVPCERRPTACKLPSARQRPAPQKDPPKFIYGIGFSANQRAWNSYERTSRTGHAVCFMTRNLEGSACTCNRSVEPSAHTRTHNRSSEAPARCRISRFRSELVEITTAWKYVFMTE